MGDRSYCEQNIIILPNEMNSFITNLGVKRGLPLGVTYIDRTNNGENKGLTKPYRANCKDRVGCNSTKYLMYFDNPLDAHLAWVKEKQSLLYSKTVKPYLINHSRFQFFAEEWLDCFSDCLVNKKEFIRNEV